MTSNSTLQELKPVIARQYLPTHSNGLGDSYCELVTISVEVERYAPYSIAKEALQLIAGAINTDIRQEYSPRAYDCTGQHFTRGLDLLKRFSCDGVIHCVYLHHISIDC